MTTEKEINPSYVPDLQDTQVIQAESLQVETLNNELFLIQIEVSGSPDRPVKILLDQDALVKFSEDVLERHYSATLDEILAIVKRIEQPSEDDDPRRNPYQDQIDAIKKLEDM